jgi:hypothetical protein
MVKSRYFIVILLGSSLAGGYFDWLRKTSCWDLLEKKTREMYQS